MNTPDRRALDDAIFDVLGLTAAEREAVHEAEVNLVRARLEKGAEYVKKGGHANARRRQ